MNDTNSHIAQQLSHVDSVLQQQRTGLAPKAVRALLSEDTLTATRSSALMMTVSARHPKPSFPDDAQTTLMWSRRC